MLNVELSRMPPMESKDLRQFCERIEEECVARRSFPLFAGRICV
jgi:hypothetical protein